MARPPAEPGQGASWAIGLWSGFRRWPVWGQVLGWLFGWWLLIPLYAWRSAISNLIKWAVTAVFAFFVLIIAIGSASGGGTKPATKAVVPKTATVASLAKAVSPTRVFTPTTLRTVSPTVASSPPPAATTRPTATPTAVPTIAPTVAPTRPPVVAAVATRAPTQPPPTIKPPTAKPRTARPAPTQDPRVSTYTKALSEETGTMGPSLGRFSDLVGTPMLTDPQWESQVAVELALWQAVYKEAQTLNPPPCLTGVQQQWIGTMSDFNDAATEFAAAVDDNDSALLQASLAKFQSGEASTKQANTLLSAVHC